jgi:Uma2 family endonuclease
MSSTAEATHAPLTVDEFIVFLDQRGKSERWELLDGVPVLMVGGTLGHSLVTGNAFGALRDMARRRGCQAHSNDLLVTSPTDNAFSAAPDVFVRCGAAPRGVRRVDDPVLVVEVLSPSTMADDRGYKFTRYVTIPALQQILFVYPEEVRVESWTRGEGEWALQVIQGLDAAVPILSLGEALPMGVLYAEG